MGGRARTPGDVLPYYAGEVDYYAKGIVPKAFIASDKAAYLRRWPNRSVTIDGQVSVVARGDTAEVVIPFRYEVSNDRERKAGSARVRLGVQEREGRYVIVREQQLPAG